MNGLASTLPECETVMGVYGGVGKIHDPQLIAEISNTSRFALRETIAAFAGVDPGMGPDQHDSKSNRASKCGTNRPRKTLFQIMATPLQNTPGNDPVCQFLNRKRPEGKPYHMHMAAGVNKFLRMYHSKVKAHLRTLEQSE